MCNCIIFTTNVGTHTYNIIIDNGVGAQVHEIEIVGGLNATKKQLLLMFIDKSETAWCSRVFLTDGKCIPQILRQT